MGHERIHSVQREYEAYRKSAESEGGEHHVKEWAKKTMTDAAGDPSVIEDWSAGCLYPVIHRAPTGPEFRYRCRKCARCLYARSRQWARRATYEIHQAPRTWFITLTVEPMAFAWRLEQWELNNPSKQINPVGLLYSEATAFLHRVRTRAQFRYLCVAEFHKSGIPHIHLLLHETVKPITYRQLGSKWNYGIIWPILADKNTAWYVTKYLMKGQDKSRIRASQHYGISTEIYQLGKQRLQYERAIRQREVGSPKKKH